MGTYQERPNAVTLQEAIGELAAQDSVRGGASFVLVETVTLGDQVAGYDTRIHSSFAQPNGDLSALDSRGWVAIDDDHGLVEHLVRGLFQHLILYEQNYNAVANKERTASE